MNKDIAEGNWGSRDFPSKNDKVLWRPRMACPSEGYYFLRGVPTFTIFE
jgi:hypothetical protein